ncbi:MAG: TolC family protein [Bacteroidia bacterium]|jgi:outer membrane protein TolC|nr:TolC family protein [Bacteroidia bacterium]MBP7245532.1 TolC family protein [Bacteroidia bacterium]
MKNLILLFLLLLFHDSTAQDIFTLESIIEKANSNYPLIKQKGYLEQNRNFNLAALNRAYLPQISINGQATYQSDVTEIPIKINIPGFSIDPLSKDQYKVVADVNQILFDGGKIHQQKNLTRASELVEQEKVNAEMQKMREKVRQLYLGVLMMDEQLKQVDLIENDLQNGINKMQSAVKNGTALRSHLAVLQAEKHKNNQRKTELSSTRNTLLKTISLFTGSTIDDKSKFISPLSSLQVQESFLIRRPELKVFEAQEKFTDTQKKLLGVKSLPRLSLFGQGGYGKPGLNMLLNEFDWFYIAGARLQWNLGELYSLSAERKSNAISKSSIQVQKEIFLLNASITAEQYRNDITKYKLLISEDNEIVDLRNEIMKASKAQLDNGVITSSDYIREMNAADQARQNLLLHQLQLIQTELDYNDYIAQP